MARPVHDLARGFDRATEAYDRGRPEYPAGAVAALAAALDLRPGRRVLDLGAGTGKLTRALASTGADRIAVEPLDGMRETFARRVPDVTVLAGTAEAIPLGDGSVDAVVCGQSFHWFDVPRAAGEIARVLRPGGGLGLVWNLRDESVPWVAELSRLMDVFDHGAPRARERAWRAPLDATGRFGPIEGTVVPFEQTVDRPTLVDRVLSVSFVAVLTDDEKARVAAAVTGLADRVFPGARTFPLPYRTEVSWTVRRPG